MFKFLKKILGISIIVAAVVSGSVFADRTAPSPFYPDGSGNWLMNVGTDELGSTDDRIAKIWAAAGDFTSITIGTISLGFTEGSVTFADASGNLAEDNANLSFNDTTDIFSVGIGLSLGTASAADGNIALENATNANTATIQSGATSGNYTLTLPLDDGDADEFLQTNGSGVLDWAAAGGVASAFDASVCSSGCDYTTVSGAVTDSKNSLILTGTITETADTALPAAGLYMYLDKGATLTMAAYKFTYADIRNVYIRGEGEIDYIQTGGNVELFDGTSYPTSVLDVSGIVIDNNSTVGGTYFATTQVMIMQDLYVDTPDFSGTFARNPLLGSYFRNVQINGGGSGAATSALRQDGNVSVMYDGLIISGTWLSGGSPLILENPANPIINNLKILSNSQMILKLSGVVTNLVGAGPSTDLIISGGNPIFTAIRGVDDIDLSGATFLSQFECAFLDMTNISSSTISNGDIDEAITLTGDNNNLTGMSFSGNVTVDSGADKNQFSNSTIIGTVSDTGDDTSWNGVRVGATAGGGGNTITIVGGANRTRILGNATDSAIVDGGAGTVGAATNTVY